MCRPALWWSGQASNLHLRPMRKVASRCVSLHHRPSTILRGMWCKSITICKRIHVRAAMETAAEYNPVLMMSDT